MKQIRQHVFLFFLYLVVFCISCSAASASDGLYTAITEDGVNLKMKRYRPSPEADFNETQPVLLFPGILCNLNEFMPHTKEERQNDYKDMTLDEPIAQWAVDDEYIENDPMMYFSIAHYLWLKGYDPWLANYRGIGRGDFRSQKGNIRTNLDIWASLDAPAFVEKIYNETGNYPVIGGHSTGGFVAYAYLQGTYMDIDELNRGYENGFIAPVKSDPELAVLRNSQIKGFIAIDPGLIPRVPDFADNILVWLLVGTPMYLDFGNLMEEVVNPIVTNSGIIITAVDLIFGMIYRADQALGEFLDIFGYLNFWYVHNTHPNVEDYFARYGLASTYMGSLAQWGNVSLRHRIREHWQNGEENKNILIPPEPDPLNDNYYYYDEHMDRVTVPTIAVLSSSSGLVGSDDVIENLMNSKTFHENDEYYEIPDSAHVDIVCGLNGPTNTFQKIGNWLSKVSPIPVSEEKTALEKDHVASSSGAPPSIDDKGGAGVSDSGGCFIILTGQDSRFSNP